jgi:hypothetical protein
MNENLKTIDNDFKSSLDVILLDNKVVIDGIENIFVDIGLTPEREKLNFENLSY